MRRAPERALQKTVVAWLKLVLPTAVVAATVNEQRGGGMSKIARARFGMARRMSGILAGAPDLRVDLEGGRTIHLELKAPGGVVSEAQQRVHAKLRAIGHTVLVADSLECLRGLLLEQGVPLREAAGQATSAAKVRYAKPKLIGDAVPL